MTCNTLQLKDDLCKTSTDLVEFVSLDNGTTTNYGLVPLEVQISNAFAGYVFPTELTYNKETIDLKNKLQDQANFSAYGFTEALTLEERILETDTPNTVVDTQSEPIRFSDGVYDRLGEELITNNITYSIRGDATYVEDGVYDVTTTSVPTGVYGVALSTSTAITSSNKKYKLKYSFSNIKVSNENCTVFFVLSLGQNSGGQTQYIINIKDNPSGELILEDSGQYFLTINQNTNATVGDSFRIAVSVREIQQAELLKAPFNPSANDGLEATTTASGSYNKADIVVCQADDNIYQATVDNPSNDLTSTDWQTLDHVTRQDIIKINKTPASVVEHSTNKGVVTISNNYDDEIASSYNYSKIGNGLFSDGTNEILLTAYHKGRLNAGIYHATYNPYGTNTSTSTPTSTYECFSLANNGVGTIASGITGHPSGKYYDKIYVDDLVFISTNAKLHLMII